MRTGRERIADIHAQRQGRFADRGPPAGALRPPRGGDHRGAVRGYIRLHGRAVPRPGRPAAGRDLRVRRFLRQGHHASGDAAYPGALPAHHSRATARASTIAGATRPQWAPSASPAHRWRPRFSTARSIASPSSAPLNHGLSRTVEVLSTPGSCVHIEEPTPASGYASGAYEKVAAVTMACWAAAFQDVEPKRMYAAGINLANLCIGGVHPKTGKALCQLSLERGRPGRPQLTRTATPSR